ncbi:glucose-1-phosphate adenylyltransferase [Paenibacillus ehimensis]|uniref:Glucose-1-phosphate adenylyltransferase n=1 Tax=Paenibacillus ehimensis TaxID=79264 RepID=A0ABT8VBJ2_9BACL|nr:glucose-1-phosphate adenylyltransferase [Paenibacillus ehimensis]MDO3678330.1 glucose-1-phosphate adenylyltransferase [Paenibacillus ehimensis]MEC0210373.1 glucose-1-phosphate adenylyltransferase [Paenibacillus ehimensis]
MRKKECVAMLLAGGEGRRLGVLTSKLAKPAVHFGGKYRIIDFTLSNCTNSGIDTVGVLTQYQPLVLNTYIGIGSPWDLDRKSGGVTVLPPYMEQSGGDWYKGTANAIYRNISFIEQFDPEYVLVISGDHIYKMDYDRMLDFHKSKGADCTIAVIEVKWEEASRFGLMSTDDGNRITEFAEKPKEPKSNLASMGIYIFNWQALKEYLIKDEADPESSKDFGKDVIPLMLRDGRSLFAYPFEGYWKDVGTIQSLWEANMDLLEDEPEFNLNDREWRIYSVNPCQPGQYVAPTAQVRRSLINEGCCVFGEVDHSVLFYGVQVGEGTVIRDSVIMPNVTIGSNVSIHKAIIGEGTVVEDGCVIGQPEGDGGGDIVLIGSNERIGRTTSASGKG